jgi:ketose-bisphosphate aldolase
MLTSFGVMSRAREIGVAIPAFNIPYLPMVEPVIRAVVDADSFAFIEVARLEWTKFEAKSPAAVMEEFRKWENPEHVRIHLDHVPVIDEDNLRVDYLSIIKDAIQLGYDSVMVDGSRLDLQGNIDATREAVEIAHNAGIPCEAELGAVLGHEAGPLPPYEELFESGRGFTDVSEAVRFVRETGCDWLSVAIGSVHGAISKARKHWKKLEARLNLDHLERLSKATGIPLVLHGGSGVKRDYVLAAMKKGIAKVNVGTEIRQAYENAIKQSSAVVAAQNAVYARTKRLIEDYFQIAGIRSRIATEEGTR